MQNSVQMRSRLLGDRRLTRTSGQKGPALTFSRRRGGLTAQAADQMHKRLAMLEDLLAQNGVDLGPDGQPINSMERPSSSHSARGRPDMKRQRTESLSQGLDSPVNPRRTSYPTPVQFDYSLTGIQSPEVESHGRLSNSSVRYSNPGSVRMPPPSPIPQSHGTLVLDQSGNSRYLGPTAGTEWLKNVRVSLVEMY